MPKSIINYKNERNELLIKIYTILGINENNKIFRLKELDINEKKQKDILDLEVEIKRYFLCSNWTYFKHKNRDWKRKYLSLIKAILKDMKINIKTHVLLDKSTCKSETLYIVDI